MAEEKKIYTWPVQLRENLVTEDTNDYVATVKTDIVTIAASRSGCCRLS